MRAASFSTELPDAVDGSGIITLQVTVMATALRLG